MSKINGLNRDQYVDKLIEFSLRDMTEQEKIDYIKAQMKSSLSLMSHTFVENSIRFLYPEILGE